ncbi:hypothetical protein HZF08_33535 [Paenibacillus sp. CGMCC 1.16610]|uniref:DUF4747 family protein n=1 Tax=Paenibacillus anseongense TaxID=2682845 RepID=A0ABW9U0R5_9BACL|nr:MULTISPECIES: hypothetical protein [Paenibacillus]MBA2943195.1 hypothetical protein [Paenibacillus sp. CGMCC 1.16610]MVQ33692.1 hypothetical protein [Paenibacillus anseongense]
MRRKFLAAKVNINSAIYSSNVNELIELLPITILNYPEWKIGKSKWVWRFSELGKNEKEEIVFGDFIKTRYEKKLIYNAASGKTEWFALPEPSAYKSFFVYNYVSEILVFEENSNVSREDFIEAFENVIYNGNMNVGAISVQLLSIKEVIKSEIAKMEYLTKIEFNLIHPNPISDDTYKDLDDIITKEKATKLKTTLENPNGLNKDGKFIQSGIEMVSKGYGGVNAYGYSRQKTYGTRKEKRVPMKYKSRDSVQMTHADKDISQAALTSKLRDFAVAVKNLLF